MTKAQAEKRASNEFDAYAQAVARRAAQFELELELAIAAAKRRWLKREVREVRRG